MTQASASQGATITVLMGVPMFLAAALVTGQLFRVGELSGESLGLLAGAGLVHFVIGRYFNYRAVGAIGAARVAPVQTFTIPYSILIAVLFLGEGVTPGIGGGDRPDHGRAGDHGGARGASAGGRRARIDGRGGGTGAALRAAAEGGIQERRPGGDCLRDEPGADPGGAGGRVRRLDPERAGVVRGGGGVSPGQPIAAEPRRAGRRPEAEHGARLFGAGFFVFLAQMLRFVALSLAPVVLVTTMARAGKVFTLGLSWFMNRELEQINLPVVLGVAVSVTGALLMILSAGASVIADGARDGASGAFGQG